MKTMYVEPVSGVYSYWVWNPSGAGWKEETPVEVVGESAKSLYIKIKIFLNGHKPGDIMRVGRKAVKMDRRHIDCSQAWWTKI